ncbi:MAG: hypothetical protein NTW79_00035 [Candidatus Berkelbacteria bacterium]|nr:hypothetical protein [Candidatus Berkelbacteria bacterium]
MSEPTAGEMGISNEDMETPEQRKEKLRSVVARIASAERGKFDEQYRAENEKAAEFVIENSLKVAELYNLEVPVEYLESIQNLVGKLNEHAGVRLTMNRYVLEEIDSADQERLPELYMKLVDMTKPFSERGQTPPPKESEIAEFIEIAEGIIAGRSAEDDPLVRVQQFKEIMFDVEGTRRDEDGESVLPADDLELELSGVISSIIESENASGVESITPENLIAMTYENLNKKKVPASWTKVPREIRTNIELAIQRINGEFAGQIEISGVGDENVGPTITFKLK